MWLRRKLSRVVPFRTLLMIVRRRGVVGTLLAVCDVARSRGLRGTVQLIGAKVSERPLPQVDPRTALGCTLVRSPKFSREHIALIGELALPQCRKYRVTQKQELVENVLSARLTISDYHDIRRCLTLMQTASKVILYRVPNGLEFGQIMTEARRLSLKVCYDIDDPMFDLEIVATNPNLVYLPKHTQKALFRDAVVFKEAMGECDLISVSTPGLQSLVRRTLSIPCHVVRNGVDRETLHFGAVASKERAYSSAARFSILLASGSLAHAADTEAAVDGVRQFLERHPDTRLITIGHFDSGAQFRHHNCVKELPYMAYSEYMRVLGTVDCALVPLAPGPFNDCKSIVRLIDATEVRVPVIASPVGEYGEPPLSSSYISAKSSDDWCAALHSVASDHDRRIKVLQEARLNVHEKRLLPAIWKALDPEAREFFAGGSDHVSETPSIRRAEGRIDA